MKDIRTIRRAVATMANQLHKLDYTLSQAFKTAWRRVKESMTCKVAGVTYGNRQQLLKYIASQKKENLTVYLRRDRANIYDRYAVAVVVGIKNVGYAHIGYLARGIAQSISEIIEKDITIKSEIRITGGYGYKETLGVLINMAV